MARTPVIPDNLHNEVVERAGRGVSPTLIAEWLSRELGRTVYPRRVNELLERIRREREPAAAAAVAVKVGLTVTADLDAVEDLIDRARDAEERARRIEAVAMQEKLPDELAEKLDDGVERQIVDRDGVAVGIDPEMAIKALEQQRKERAEQARLAELRLKLSGAGEGSDGNPRPKGRVIILPPEDPPV